MFDFDPYAEAFLDDPLPIYARLREESPVVRGGLRHPIAFAPPRGVPMIDRGRF